MEDPEALEEIEGQEHEAQQEEKHDAPAPAGPHGSVDAEKPRLLRSLRGGHGGGSSGGDGACFTCCTFVRGRSQIACGARDGSVLLWPAAAHQEERHRRPTRLGGGAALAGTGAASSSTTPMPASCVVGSEAGDLIAVSSTDGAVRVWRNQAGRQTPTVLKVHFGPVRACDFSPRHARLLLSGSDDKLVKLSSLPDRRFVASLVGHTNWVQSAVFAPGSGEFAASGGDDRTVRLWDTERHAGLRVWHDCAGSVSCVRFDATGNAVAGCSWDSSINIWDVRSHALRQHYGRAHGSSPVSQIAFHPTEDLLLSTSTDRTLRLWDLRAGRLRFTVKGHDKPVHACAWDDEGGRFVSCDNQIAHLWQLPGGAKAARPAAQVANSFVAPHTVRGAMAAPCPHAMTAGRTALQRRSPDNAPGRRASTVGSRSRPAEAQVATTHRAHLEPLAGKPAFNPELPLQSPAARPASARRAPIAEKGTQERGHSESVKIKLPPHILQEAWQGDMPAPKPVEPSGIVAASSAQQPVELPAAAWQEAFAGVVERMVSQMDVITQTLQSMEARVARTEESVAELVAAKSRLRETVN